MYTATKLGESTNQQLQRRTITVRFDNGQGHVFEKDFFFAIATTVEAIKKAVKAYLDEINLVVAPVDDLNPAPDPEPVSPTQAELDRTAWELDVSRLKNAQALLDCGVVFSAPQLTALATLRTKIATNFKSEYLG